MQSFPITQYFKLKMLPEKSKRPESSSSNLVLKKLDLLCNERFKNSVTNWSKLKWFDRIQLRYNIYRYSLMLLYHYYTHKLVLILCRLWNYCGFKCWSTETQKYKSFNNISWSKHFNAYVIFYKYLEDYPSRMALWQRGGFINNLLGGPQFESAHI